MKIIGIYKIINKINGHYYIGSSDDITRRWQHHKSYLTRKKHRNIHLTNAWHKYGAESFEFIIIKEVPKENLIVEEQKFLDEAKADIINCYNQYFIAGGSVERRKPKKGFKWSEEQRRQMSIQRKGRKHSDETKQKISLGLVGNQNNKKSKEPSLSA